MGAKKIRILAAILFAVCIIFALSSCDGSGDLGGLEVIIELDRKK